MTAAQDSAGVDPTRVVDLICVTSEHIESGKRVPDGQGTLTVSGRQWAYCTAGLENLPHDWKETGGVPLDSIRHSDPVAPLPSS